MLALMAARAGAVVTTCDTHPVAAQLARELAERNGLADRITVIAKDSRALALGSDLPRPADLLFCDLFADNLFAFEPFALVADAQARLLKPGARVLPRRASLRVALAWSPDLNTGVGNTCGFDISPMRDFVADASKLRIGDPDVRLCSAPQDAFRYDLTRAPRSGEVELRLTVDADGAVNGVARWIRLDLDETESLEARPKPGARFFSSPTFVSFGTAIDLRAGETLRIGLSHGGKVLETWLAGRG
jgi:type II protein arginine methyltransferase